MKKQLRLFREQFDPQIWELLMDNYMLPQDCDYFEITFDSTTIKSGKIGELYGDTSELVKRKSSKHIKQD